MDAGDIAGCLHHTTKGFVLTDGVDAVVDGLYGPDEVLGDSSFDDGLGIGTLHVPDHLCISNVEFILDF